MDEQDIVTNQFTKKTQKCNKNHISNFRKMTFLKLLQ